MAAAVLFDLFETLITESGADVPRASSLGPRLGLDPDAFRAEWRVRRQSVVLGQLSMRDVLVEIARSLGQEIPTSELERALDARVRAKAAILRRCNPEVLTMVRLLRQRGLHLAVISNCFAEDVTAWSECPLAPHFSEIMFSFETGLAKPDPAVYMETCRRLRVAPEDAAFIGDGAQNELEGAEAAGIRAYQALWFREARPHEHLRQPVLSGANDVLAVIKI